MPMPSPNAQAELVLDHEQMPDHALLDGPVALREAVDQVRDELVALPLLRVEVALAGLLVVVGARDSRPGDAAADLRALLVMRGLRSLAEAAEDGRLVVDARVR